MGRIKALEIAIPAIKKHEGCVLKAYPDPATGGEPYTIGWGNTFYLDNKKVQKGDTISQMYADAMLEKVAKEFMLDVEDLLGTTVVNDYQLAALTCFTYNVGVGNLRKSTLLKKVKANPNDTTIAAEFAKWNKAAGKVMRGLTNRRKDEADLYFTKI
mgnify:CR=1 FL=1